ncbi:heavy metal response regulator transcription factor [Achromobacter anxifer]
MRLLVVEDEPKTASHLKRGLTGMGFTVDLSGDGIEGLFLALEHDYDAIVLDVMLPGQDGHDVLRLLRARKQTPVLMLSARGSVDERVKGLRQGADDYLPKPYSFIELVARIQALLRRRVCPGGDSTVLQVDDLQIDLLARRVTRARQRLDLTAKEFALLSLLARHQGEIPSKMMISEQVWDMNFDSDANVVEVAMRRLRLKVDAPYEKKLLHTVRGMGYLLESRAESHAAPP